MFRLEHSDEGMTTEACCSRDNDANSRRHVKTLDLGTGVQSCRLARRRRGMRAADSRPSGFSDCEHLDVDLDR